MISVNNNPPVGSNYGGSDPDAQLRAELLSFEEKLKELQEDIAKGITPPTKLLEALHALHDAISDAKAQDPTLQKEVQEVLGTYTKFLDSQQNFGNDVKKAGAATDKFLADLQALLKSLGVNISEIPGLQGLTNKIGQLEQLLKELKEGKDVSGQIHDLLASISSDLTAAINSFFVLVTPGLKEAIQGLQTDLNNIDVAWGGIPENPKNTLADLIKELEGITGK